MLPTIAWVKGTVKMIDQRRLPTREVYITCRQYQGVAHAIRTMVIRGAPAIGVAAAYGVALAARQAIRSRHLAFVERAIARLAQTRPTAVNLFWALDRMRRVLAHNLDRGRNPGSVADALLKEARAIERGDLAMNRCLARLGARLLKSGWNVLTYCNTGGLATAGVGTAFGILEEAHRQGKRIHVFPCETRPVLQGLRLTTWELARAKVPFTLITDNMAGALMAQGRIHAIVVGADRIAANGDVANKIGTYTLATLARAHHVPFYVAAPWSTIDGGVRSGASIPIEERGAEELFKFYLPRVRPPHVSVLNPAFDITPARLVSAIITDRGIHRPPYKFSKK